MSATILGVHGINHRQSDAEAVRKRWQEALIVGFGDRSPRDVWHRSASLEIAYYADLYSPYRQRQGGQVDLTSDEEQMVRLWLADIGYPAPQGAVANALGQFASAVAKRLDRMPTWLVRRLIEIGAKDAAEYLWNATIRASIRERLAESLESHSPRVVIAHSLGSVIAYETLHSWNSSRIELLITIGSPLATPNAILAYLDPAPLPGASKPACVERWVNIFHPGDLVASVGQLSRDFPDVDKDVRIDARMRECHDAETYLNSEAMADLLGPFISRA